MQNRNPLLAALLPYLTFGIYGLYWLIVTSGELKNQGQEIPHWILLFVPFANFYWYYKYAAAVEQVSNGRQSTTLVFLLFLFLWPAGAFIAQSAFNQSGDTNGFAPAGPANTPAQDGITAQQPSVMPSAPATAAAATPFTAATAPQAISPDTPSPENAVAQAPVDAAPIISPTTDSPVVEGPQVITPTVVSPQTSEAPTQNDEIVVNSSLESQTTLPEPTPTPQNQVFEPRPDETQTDETQPINPPQNQV